PEIEIADNVHEHSSSSPLTSPAPESTLISNDPTAACDENESIGATFANLRVDSDQSELEEPREDRRDVQDNDGDIADENQYEANSDGEDVDSDDDSDGEADSEEKDLKDENALRVLNNQPIPIEEAEKMIVALEKMVKDNRVGRGKRTCSKLDDITLYRIRLMTQTLRTCCAMNVGLVKASQIVAAIEFRKPHMARRIRQWIRHFQTTEMAPENLYGRRWNETLIEDQEFRQAVKAYMLTVGKYAQARDIVKFFGLEEGSRYYEIFGGCPSLRTAQDWMGKLGYGWGRERRGQYADGHERPDVVEYRMKNYIPEWMEREARMRSWDEGGKEIPMVLTSGERVVVVWFHDESTFFTHDRPTFVWQERGKGLGIQKKGERVSLMVARDSQVIFRAGKNRDGWFCSRDVKEQFSRALEIVKEKYPDEEHLFVFDDAPIHTRLPDDAPLVALVTLKVSKKVKAETISPEGEKIKINMAPARFADGSPQELYYPMDYPKVLLRGQFKGLTTLLEERGVPNARKLKLRCPKDATRSGCPPGRTDCCAQQTMANQPDFLEQKTALQILAESHGCSVLYLPKYHCELNPIEQCWGAAKRTYRVSPFSSAEADLRKNMLASLDSVLLK
ncbi:hypothetical protein FRC07_015158, partial [Ceratobasidium sp. 392]